jgi:diguanylate cyclase (GGDEF)-like protein
VVYEETLSSVLSEFAHTMLADSPVQGILDHLVGRIVDVLPVTGAGVTLIEADLAPSYVAASDASALRLEKLQTEMAQGPSILAYHSGEAVLAPELAADTRFPRFGPAAVASGLAAVFAFPLRHGAGRLGALDLYRDRVGSLDSAEMVAAQTLADVAAAYLINAQARDDEQAQSARFERSSLHDPLTGLPNRLLLEQRIEQTALRARRSHTSAAVLFADLDRFKAVNDRYGHRVGDELLIAVARRLSDLLRPGDTLARVSGDEFVIVCEELTNPGMALALANRISAGFLAPFWLDAAEITITASVGIAYAGPGEAISPQLMINADMAMYRAKRSGGATHQMHDLRGAHSAAAVPRPNSTIAEMRTEISYLVGNLDFEQARGILMEVHGITADDAFSLIAEVSATAGAAPQELIVRLVGPTTRATALSDIAQVSVNLAEFGSSGDGRTS